MVSSALKSAAATTAPKAAATTTATKNWVVPVDDAIIKWIDHSYANLSTKEQKRIENMEN